MVEVHARGGGVEVAAARAHLGVGLGHQALDLSEVAEGPAEGLAVLRVLGHDLHAPLGDAAAHRGQAEPLDLEVAHHVHVGVALLAYQVAGRHAAVVEDQLGRGRRAHAALVADLLAQGEARGALLHHEEADARGLALLARVRPRVHEEVVTGGHAVDRAVGDPHFGASELVVAVGAALGNGAHAQHVGAGLGLRHTHAGNRGARAGLGQEALFLIVVAIAS
mmetsp:Transcript_12808/g.35502  ORF Transcript_12808/g.35502 Transcript_12808/m.35502 type:complete len:222 (+) Transcript_12808:537-1202(+)